MGHPGGGLAGGPPLRFRLHTGGLGLAGGGGVGDACTGASDGTAESGP